MEWKGFDSKLLSGRNRRLLNEWKRIDECLEHHSDIEYTVRKTNGEGLPVVYEVTYHIRSIASVEELASLGNPEVPHPPVFAERFVMEISLPPGYPCIDAPAAFRFLCQDAEAHPIPHPWHPNIRFFGEFAGRVCLNALDTFVDLAWGIERIALYLRYELYHAWPEPPYPEDMKVAEWVVKEGEPKHWVFFDQPRNQTAPNK